MPVPKLDKDGRLPVSALCTWARELADWSGHQAASDWRSAADLYRAQLQAELRAQVDSRLVIQARQARADRVAVEAALDAARAAVEEHNLPDGAPISVATAREHRDRRQAVTDAMAKLPVVRAAERDAIAALRREALPVYQAAHCRSAFLVQETGRAARALVEDSKRALREIERIDVEALLMDP